MKTFDERKAILEIEITKLLKKGWRITNKGETSCQLQKDKIRDGCLAAILFLLFIIPGIIYLILTPRRTFSIYIEVNEEGKINYSSTDISPYQLKQASTLANKDLNK